MRNRIGTGGGAPCLPVRPALVYGFRLPACPWRPMMRLRRCSLRLAAVALPLALAACKGGGGAGDAVGASGAKGGSLKMGAALSMTGAAATYGQSQKNGLEAGTEEVNGANTLQGIKLELLIEDDATSKEQGINVFQRFINTDKVSVIIGPTLSTTATAADPLAQQARVPVLAISNTSPTGITDIGDYIWRDSLTEAQVVPGAVKKAKEKLQFKAAGVLYGNDDVFTTAGYDVMKKALGTRPSAWWTRRRSPSRTGTSARSSPPSRARTPTSWSSPRWRTTRPPSSRRPGSSGTRVPSWAGTGSTAPRSSRTPGPPPRASWSALPGTPPALLPRTSDSRS